MGKQQAPYRVDHVGSFLRSERLKEAKLAEKNGQISLEKRKEIESEEIEALVAQQVKAGLKGITDGEFRRGFWHLDFLEGLDGVEGYTPEQYNQVFHGKPAPAYNIRLVDRVSFSETHPFIEDFRQLKKVVDQYEGVEAKATIPSPTMLLRQELLANDGTSHLSEIYPDLNEFYQDLATAYQEAIQAFYAAGCRYLQFDDTNWAFLADATKRAEITQKGIDPEYIAAICTKIINASLANKPVDMVITTHICRGNHASSWLFSGGYEPIAKELFATDYDGFFLEYDSDRAGDFTPLRYWKEAGKKSQVVLGLVTSKTPELEDPEQIKARVLEAQAYIPLEYLSISPQCGFASTEEGNHLTFAEQWDKINHLQTIAQNIWVDHV